MLRRRRFRFHYCSIILLLRALRVDFCILVLRFDRFGLSLAVTAALTLRVLFVSVFVFLLCIIVLAFIFFLTLVRIFVCIFGRCVVILRVGIVFRAFICVGL